MRRGTLELTAPSHLIEAHGESDFPRRQSCRRDVQLRLSLCNVRTRCLDVPRPGCQQRIRVPQGLSRVLWPQCSTSFLSRCCLLVAI